MASKCCATKLIYRYLPPEEAGFRARWWGPDAGPHLNPRDWAGPTDFSGHPLPTANAPLIDVVNSSGNVNDSNSGAEAARYGIISGYFFLPQAGFVRDNNQNTGELGYVLLGDCCGGPLVEGPGGNDTNTVTADRGLLDPTFRKAGWHCLYSPHSDQSAFSGVDLEFSVDGENDWTDVQRIQPELPEVECIEIPSCQEIPEGWQRKPLANCCEPKFTPPVDVEVPLASTIIPVPDNEVDTAIRTGQIGTSSEFALADHNHPIRRQENPGDPVVTMGGNFVELQSLILDRGSDEESYWWRFRVRVSQVAGTGWGWVQFPTIAGFQQPVFMEVGGYMNPSVAVQDDDGAFGASPRGPFMGYPIHHWSSTNRLYGGYFRRDNDVTSLYVNTVVKYTRI